MLLVRIDERSRRTLRALRRARRGPAGYGPTPSQPVLGQGGSAPRCRTAPPGHGLCFSRPDRRGRAGALGHDRRRACCETRISASLSGSSPPTGQVAPSSASVPIARKSRTAIPVPRRLATLASGLRRRVEIVSHTQLWLTCITAANPPGDFYSGRWNPMSDRVPRGVLARNSTFRMD